MRNRDFKQIKAGPIENVVYAIGFTEIRECVLVGPAWEVSGRFNQLDQDDMTLVGARVTHYHPDHCGGSMIGFIVEGLPTLMTERPVRVYVNEYEAAGLKQITGLSDSDLKKQSSGDKLSAGQRRIHLSACPAAHTWQPMLSSR